MTIEEAKKRIVSLANSEIGYREGANNWNKYAEDPQIHKLYGWYPQNQPYCDIFVDWLFISCFGYDLASAMTYQYTGKGSAACATSANYYMSHNAWFDRPQVGDQVFFNVSGGINHTGIVTDVGMGAIVTVEGNSSDMVARRTYDIKSPAIAGYGRPKWSVLENYDPPEEEPEPEPEPKPVVMVKIELPQITEGDISDSVKAAQALLDCWGFPCGSCGADGEYGPDTKRAITRFQKYRRLEQDGVIGPDTWSALLGVREE